MSLQSMYRRIDDLLGRELVALQAGHSNEARILRTEINKLNKEIDRLA